MHEWLTEKIVCIKIIQLRFKCQIVQQVIKQVILLRAETVSVEIESEIHPIQAAAD